MWTERAALWSQTNKANLSLMQKSFLFLKMPPTEEKQQRSLARLGTFSEKPNHETFTDMPKDIKNENLM